MRTRTAGFRLYHVSVTGWSVIVGIEPTTNRLLVSCSTLLSYIHGANVYLYILYTPYYLSLSAQDRYIEPEPLNI